jgi:hypothetical protein
MTYRIINNEETAGGVTEVVEHLPSKLEALSSNSIPPKKKKKGKEKTQTFKLSFYVYF